jgi:gamma-carbonic anhydrase
MKLISYKGLYPEISKDAYIAEGAIIAGDVQIGANSGIWFNSVLRGDVAPIRVGENTNIQDGSIVHTSRFDGPTDIGSNVTIGHMALIHACTIKDNAFIGMSSTIMDKAVIEEFAFVGAGSIVTPGKFVKSREMWMGAPAKFIRFISEDEEKFMQDNVKNYIELAKHYRN